MPPIDFSARRLICVNSAADAVATAEHIAATHGTDVRFVMTSPSEPALAITQQLTDAIQPLVLGKLATSQSDMLRELEELETVDDFADRTLMTRDYLLRGTRPGTASVLVSHGTVLQLLLARADDISSSCEAAFESFRSAAPPEAAVCVLDYGDGSFPEVVAAEKPIVREQWIG